MTGILSGRRHLSEDEYKLEFAQFVEKFDKKYENALEWAGRYETFKHNLDEIHYHNNYRNSTFTKGKTWILKDSETLDLRNECSYAVPKFT